MPLSDLGVAGKTNLTDIWIQFADDDGTTNTFYLDDIQFDAKTISPPPATTAINPARGSVSSTAPVMDNESQKATINTSLGASNVQPNVIVFWIVGALAIIIILLGWLIFVLKRSTPDASKIPAPGTTMDITTSAVSNPAATDFPESIEQWKQRALVAEAMAGTQGQMLRDKIMPELTEFAKQSLVQGLYAQRNVLLETQQKAQQALTQLESQLAGLHLPLQERIRAYEKRIAELEKEVETQGEEMRELTRATLILVRKKLEDEKELGRAPGRFN